MIINTSKALSYSWMSQASYLDLISVIPDVANSLQDSLQASALNDGKFFSAQQAKIFTDSATGYSFINQLPNTTNGTSATVFKSNVDGSYTLAVRGTEPGAQLGTDLLEDAIGVVSAGKAKVQLIEAFRYYKQLTTPAGQAVSYSNTEVHAIAQVLMSGTALTGSLENLAAAKSAFAAMIADDKGLGQIPAGATINFAGHSLGGHVAYLLASLVNQTAGAGHPVGDVMTYNAPGENALIYELQNWLGIDTSTQAGAIGGKHLAFYGEGGLNVTAGLGQVIGTRVPLFIEDSGAVDGNIAMENHSIVKLSDALALYDTFNKLSPALSQRALENILKGASNDPLKSLEATLDALRTLLQDGTIGADAAKQTKAGDREDFYDKLYELQASSGYTGLKGSAAITALNEQGNSNLASQGKSDFGTFLALNYLLPFAITHAGSTLNELHKNTYEAWRADQSLTPEQRAAGAANYSDQWYADRAAMLAYVMQANIEDATGALSVAGAQGMHYQDQGSGQQIDIGLPDDTVAKRQTVFGDGQNNTLEGKKLDDHLYGGAGSIKHVTAGSSCLRQRFYRFGGSISLNSIKTITYNAATC